MKRVVVLNGKAVVNSRKVSEVAENLNGEELLANNDLWEVQIDGNDLLDI